MEKRALVSVKDAAIILKKSIPTIYRLCKDGTLECAKLDKKCYITRDSVERYKLTGTSLIEQLLNRIEQLEDRMAQLESKKPIRQKTVQASKHDPKAVKFLLNRLHNIN